MGMLARADQDQRLDPGGKQFDDILDLPDGTGAFTAKRSALNLSSPATGVEPCAGDFLRCSFPNGHQFRPHGHTAGNFDAQQRFERFQTARFGGGQSWNQVF